VINNQRIIVTGSSGFVGLNLIQHLSSKSYKIQSLNLRNTNWESNIDIEATAIIHLAGKAHDLKNVANPNEYYEVNYELTKQLFDAFLESSASIFLFMSSVKAVADEVIGVLTEELEANPQTHYGMSKHEAEIYILSKKLPVGKRLYILRPCMIHGPDNNGNLSLLYKLVSRGIPWPLGAFENKRSFSSIDNVCFVIDQILKNESIPSGIYNLADDQAISTNRLIELIAISQNKFARIYTIPKKFIITIAKFGDYLKLPINSERLEKLTQNFVVSNDKIVKAIGTSLPLNAEDGLMKTFNSFK
jgi:nucleoside-diphosphate-sugar epimerase